MVWSARRRGRSRCRATPHAAPRPAAPATRSPALRCTRSGRSAPTSRHSRSGRSAPTSRHSPTRRHSPALRHRLARGRAAPGRHVPACRHSRRGWPLRARWRSPAWPRQSPASLAMARPRRPRRAAWSPTSPRSRPPGAARSGSWPGAKPRVARLRWCRHRPASAGRGPAASGRRRAAGTRTPRRPTPGTRTRRDDQRRRHGRGADAGPGACGRDRARADSGRRSGRRRDGVERADRPGDQLRKLAALPGAARPLGGRQRDPRRPDGQPVHADHEPQRRIRGPALQPGVLRRDQLRPGGVRLRPADPVRPRPRPMGRDPLRRDLQRRCTVRRRLRRPRPDRVVAEALPGLPRTLARLPHPGLLVVARGRGRQPVRRELRLRWLGGGRRLRRGEPARDGLGRPPRRRRPDRAVDRSRCPAPSRSCRPRG